MLYVVLALVIAGVSVAGGYFFFNLKSKSTKNDSHVVSQPTDINNTEPEVDKQAMVVQARAKAKEILLEAKDESLRIKSQAEDQARSTRDKASELEKKLATQKGELDSREKEIESKAKSLKSVKETLERKEEDLARLIKKQKEELEKVASMTKQEAREQLLKQFDKELTDEKGKKIRQMEEEIKKTSEEKAKTILLDAMRYGATDLVVEYTTSKVKLPDDELKGRIIGKEGRNIKKFEELTGVELDLDSAPGEILISSFDPIRREIAKVALERLMADGRIQPVKIEEIVEKTQKEVEHTIYKEGDNLCHRLGIYNLPDEIVATLGKFKFRFSYGQNMIEHTLEVARIGTAIAHELKANVDTVKMGCLLHDIGKVITDEEGTHVELGVELLKRHKIDEKVVNAVAEHHEDKPFSSIESIIVALADHISGARPNARSEDYESYVKRLKDLEDAAKSFDGVEKVYAVSAGRDIRVFVQPDKVDDDSCVLLARDIAKKIELEQTYPGTVKVTVIRETRVTDTAK